MFLTKGWDPEKALSNLNYGLGSPFIVEMLVKFLFGPTGGYPIYKVSFMDTMYIFMEKQGLRFLCFKPVIYCDNNSTFKMKQVAFQISSVRKL